VRLHSSDNLIDRFFPIFAVTEEYIMHEHQHFDAIDDLTMFVSKGKQTFQ
jgi:hypothetical protein